MSADQYLLTSHFGVLKKVENKEDGKKNKPKLARTVATIDKELMHADEDDEEKAKEDIKELIIKIKEETKQDIIEAKQEILTDIANTKETYFSDRNFFCDRNFFFI